METKPTPGREPKYIASDGLWADTATIQNKQGFFFAEAANPWIAAHIVKCVNAHDGLERALLRISTMTSDSCIHMKLIALKALKAIEGGE